MKIYEVVRPTTDDDTRDGEINAEHLTAGSGWYSFVDDADPEVRPRWRIACGSLRDRSEVVAVLINERKSVYIMDGSIRVVENVESMGEMDRRVIALAERCKSEMDRIPGLTTISARNRALRKVYLLNVEDLEFEE